MSKIEKLVDNLTMTYDGDNPYWILSKEDFLVQLRALVDEVIGENTHCSIVTTPAGSDICEGCVTYTSYSDDCKCEKRNALRAEQRQLADELFSVQEEYTAGHGGYDENFNADAELDKKTDMGEADDN